MMKTCNQKENEDEKQNENGIMKQKRDENWSEENNEKNMRG